MKITGLLFWVQENKLSEKFYKKLGFEIIKSQDGHSIVQLGDTTITLVNIRDDDEFQRDAFSGDKGRGMYVYIRTEDVDTTFEQFTKLGVQPATEPRDWPWGNREFIIKDPDGFKLCFWQPI